MIKSSDARPHQTGPRVAVSSLKDSIEAKGIRDALGARLRCAEHIDLWGIYAFILDPVGSDEDR